MRTLQFVFPALAAVCLGLLGPFGILQAQVANHKHHIIRHQKRQASRLPTEDRQKQFYLALVTLQDKYTAKGDAMIQGGHVDQGAQYNNEMSKRAYVVIAHRYGITVDQMRKIAVRGSVENWPIPPLPGDR